MDNKKYEFTGETKKWKGHTLHRIRAIVGLDDVKKGDIGGWIENESNLSNDARYYAWVYDNAMVYGHASVTDNAQVYDNAEVYGDCLVRDNATVYKDAKICGYADVCGNAGISDCAEIHGYARVGGWANVVNSAHVYGCAVVGGYAHIGGYAKVCGCAEVKGNVCIIGNAVVKTDADYAVFKNCWSSARWFTYTRSNKMWRVGCFYGTGEELIIKAYKDSERSGRCYEAIVRAMESIDQIMKEKTNGRK